MIPIVLIFQQQTENDGFVFSKYKLIITKYNEYFCPA